MNDDKKKKKRNDVEWKFRDFLFWATFDSKLFWCHADVTLVCFLNRSMGRRGGQVHPLDRWWAWTPSVNFMWVDMKNTHLSYCLRALVSRTAFKVMCFFPVLLLILACLMSWNGLQKTLKLPTFKDMHLDKKGFRFSHIYPNFSLVLYFYL